MCSSDLDGARDSEAVTVIGDFFWILSKRDEKPRMYRLPLAPAEETITAEFVAEIGTWPYLSERDVYQDPLWAGGRRMPTAMTATEELLVIATYGPMFLYPIVEHQPVFDALPAVLNLPRTSGREAVTRAARGLITVNEREDQHDAADIFLITLE